MIRRLTYIAAIITAIMLTASAVTVHADTMGVSAGHDLDALLARAQKSIDLSAHDAVLLLERRALTVESDGTLRTQVHRVVWIGTARAIREHADLRIPFNSATSSLNVLSLRTWRDDRWWPDESEISPTAVVETLPYAVARADDYTTMRETMLLHDGVELPCIMETSYEIEETTGAGGFDGHWVFPKRDPALVVELSVTAPAGAALVFAAGNGAPEPEVARVNATETYAWRMEDVAPIGSPAIHDPAVYAPYVTWSTWANWRSMGREFSTAFDGAAVMNETLTDTLVSYLRDKPTDASKVRAVASFVNECSRSIHYDSRYWTFSPRPAARTWETAYGHGLDRAVLAAALFRHIGLDSRLVFRSNPATGIDTGIPGIARFADFGIRVAGGGIDSFYDPADGTLSDSGTAFGGRTVWAPGSGREPSLVPVLGDDDKTSRFELVLTLEPGEKDTWKGKGFLRADGLFSRHGEMAGLDGESLAVLSRVAGSALPGAKVTAFNPEVFEPGRVAVGFDFEMTQPEPDSHGRTGFSIGAPAGGIESRLPTDVHLYNEMRTSPVPLPAKMTQRVTLKIKTTGKELVHVPDTREIDNTIGHFSLKSEYGGGWASIERELTLFTLLVDAAAWPQLRELLLEEAENGGSTILLK